MDLLLSGAEVVVIKDIKNTEVFIAFFASDKFFSQAWTHNSLCLVMVSEGVKYYPLWEKNK